MLRMKLLGGAQFMHDDAPLAGFISAKSQALLCYLAVTRRAQRRDTLCGLLWAEKPDADAKLSLRVALSNLHRLLAPNLIINRETAIFNAQSEYWLDVEAFEAPIPGLAGTMPPRAVEKLREQVELYSGDFLAGFYVRDAPGFEEWTLGPRARYRRLALEAIYLLAAQYSAQHEYSLAIDYTARLLELEPWQEEAHLRMMQLLNDIGQHGAALAQYETCRLMLATEFNLAPSEAMRLLAARIRAAR